MQFTILELCIGWHINVVIQRFPEDELFHCSSKEVVESYFMSMVKEADCLKHNSRIIGNMQKRDHKQLWLGLQNGIYLLPHKSGICEIHNTISFQ